MILIVKRRFIIKFPKAKIRSTFQSEWDEIYVIFSIVNRECSCETLTLNWSKLLVKKIAFLGIENSSK